MIIARDILLNRLIEAKSHNLIKILVGIRRCGKSFLLFKLFKQHLLDSGVTPNHIIEIDLESDIGIMPFLLDPKSLETL